MKKLQERVVAHNTILVILLIFLLVCSILIDCLVQTFFKKSRFDSLTSKIESLRAGALAFSHSRRFELLHNSTEVIQGHLSTLKVREDFLNWQTQQIFKRAKQAFALGLVRDFVFRHAMILKVKKNVLSCRIRESLIFAHVMRKNQKVVAGLRLSIFLQNCAKKFRSVYTIQALSHVVLKSRSARKDIVSSNTIVIQCFLMTYRRSSRIKGLLERRKTLLSKSKKSELTPFHETENAFSTKELSCVFNKSESNSNAPSSISRSVRRKPLLGLENLDKAISSKPSVLKLSKAVGSSSLPDTSKLSSQQKRIRWKDQVSGDGKLEIFEPDQPHSPPPLEEKPMSSILKPSKFPALSTQSRRITQLRRRNFLNFDLPSTKATFQVGRVTRSKYSMFSSHSF